MNRTGTARTQGELAEMQAERWLVSRGLRPLARNHRCRGGEIDLIMGDGNALVFVEVRLRGSAAFGGAEASVTRSKQRRISIAARHFLATRPDLSNRPCRFDVMAMARRGAGFTYNWIRDAFAAWE